ncbi:hypothetical protein KXV75_005864 [Aspergillus fumigatus]|nr:hypothetical protein KXX56_002420 [Aspergillus fumigatus]KAH2093283.1 hypothetical protein KXW86_004822 [Aspergillus fumigatus]KAH2907848.1 hypothetical protein KXV75_005864 [Aspergillus fumigatus]KAH3332142.1 hypothetical protein KXW13_003877 [Aspergillus fumigatus]
MKTATSANEGPHFAVPSADVVEATGAKNTSLCTLQATINRQQATVQILAQFNRDSVPDAFIWVGIEEVKRFAFALHKVAGRVIPNATTACFSLPDGDEPWNTTSDLAARLAEDESLYHGNINPETNWISHS